MRVIRFISLLAIVAALGCSDDPLPGPVGPGPDGGLGNGGSDGGLGNADAAPNRDAPGLDGDGPEIVLVSPEPGEVVSGLVTITVEITDPAGLLDDSVIATMVTPDNNFRLFRSSGTNTFRGSFDTRELDNASIIVFADVIVRARSSLGIESAFGFIVTLDNTPPRISLDPPQIREGRFEGTTLECSRLFDPVGSDAINDLSIRQPQLSEIRAWVEDRANGASSAQGVVTPAAGVAEATVELFVLDDDSAANALVIDRTDDADDICDEINPLLIPSSIPMASNEVALIELGALDPTGDSHFAPPLTPFSGPDGDCSPPADSPPAPDPLCFQSPASRIIANPLTTDVPVIYSIPPANELQCLGFAFDFIGANISEGWACVAVRAEDAVGNVAISPPLRVCFDDFIAGNGAPDCSLALAPDCRGTYDPSSGILDAATDCRIDTIENLFVEAEVQLQP